MIKKLTYFGLLWSCSSIWSSSSNPSFSSICAQDFNSSLVKVAIFFSSSCFSFSTSSWLKKLKTLSIYKIFKYNFVVKFERKTNRLFHFISSPGFGEGFKCSSIAFSNNRFLSLTDNFGGMTGVGDGVDGGCFLIFDCEMITNENLNNKTIL